MNIVIWYLIGLLSMALFVIVINWRQGTDIKYGEVVLVFFLAIGGPVVAAGVFFFLILAGAFMISSWDIWEKPVFTKKSRRD